MAAAKQTQIVHRTAVSLLILHFSLHVLFSNAKMNAFILISSPPKVLPNMLFQFVSYLTWGGIHTGTVKIRSYERLWKSITLVINCHCLILFSFRTFPLENLANSWHVPYPFPEKCSPPIPQGAFWRISRLTLHFLICFHCLSSPLPNSIIFTFTFIIYL